MTGFILFGVAAYVAVILGIGLASARRVRNNADYIVAGRRLPFWLCSFTLFATWFGGGTALGAAGAAYEGGLLGVVADPFGAALCLILFGLFYARVLRRMRLVTIADYFRERFGGSAELIAALCVLPPYLGWVGSQFVAFGFILNTLTGLDNTTAIVIGAAVVVAYTVAGGLWAVSLTDFVQSGVLIVGLIVLGVAVLLLDPSFSWEAVPAAHLAVLPETSLHGWLWYLQAWFVIGLGAIPSQDLVQRGLSARSESVAAWSSYTAALGYLTVGLLPVFLGMAGSVLIPGLENPELVLPRLCLEYLPPLGVAVVLGALLSAIMSTADSALLAPAGILSENVFRVLRPDLSDRALLRISRGSVPLFGLAALAIGLYFENVYDLMVNSWSVMLVSLLVPLTAGIYWRRTSRAAALASIGVGVVSWLVLSIVQERWPADLAAAALAAATLVAVTLAKRNGDSRVRIP